MSTQIYGYRAAEGLALEYSKRNPTQAYYVNWVEDNEFSVDTEPELSDQRYVLAGVWHYPEFA